MAGPSLALWLAEISCSATQSAQLRSGCGRKNPNVLRSSEVIPARVYWRPHEARAGFIAVWSALWGIIAHPHDFYREIPLSPVHDPDHIGARRISREKRRWRALIHLDGKTSEFGNQGLGGHVFHSRLKPSTFCSHPHSGSHIPRGEFLFLRLPMYFDSSYITPSFQQRNRIRCHLNAKARSAAWWRLPTARS